ncbi:MAG TPA: tripartite tricarboxylate transporter TctB family protein [Methylomirabilota bacterium]|nr:tripartite tricarboxylate transporter TctB family protein [Methylomirabilota bacterium]
MRDVASAALLLLGAAGAFVHGRRLPFGSIAAPGPGFFPLTVAAALAGVAAVLLVRALAARVAPAGPTAAPGARLRLVAVVGALFAFTVVLEPLGFVVATFLLMLVLFRVVEQHRWTIVVAESAAAAVASHVLFKTWLGVRLPPGPWGF